MKSLINCLISFFVLVSPALSQKLSPESKKIAFACTQLKNHAGLKQYQLAYLESFPANKKAFVAVFNPEDFTQLYDNAYDYIVEFTNLAKYYPVEVIGKEINIGKDMVWEADAPGYLQQSIVDLGNRYPAIFSKKLHTLPVSQVDGLIRFLADVENHKSYHTYQTLIESLNKLGEKALATKLVIARKLRMRIKDH